jgi:hypothetical protein
MKPRYFRHGGFEENDYTSRIADPETGNDKM